MSNSNRYIMNEISPDGRNDGRVNGRNDGWGTGRNDEMKTCLYDGRPDHEPFEIDFDAMSEGCMSNMSFTMVLIIIFVLAAICN